MTFRGPPPGPAGSQKATKNGPTVPKSRKNHNQRTDRRGAASRDPPWDATLVDLAGFWEGFETELGGFWEAFETLSKRQTKLEPEVQMRMLLRLCRLCMWFMMYMLFILRMLHMLLMPTLSRRRDL